MRVLLILFLVLTVILFTNCGKDEVTEYTDGNVIMPLAVGNEWIGTLRSYSYDGTLIDEYPWVYRLDDSGASGSEIWYDMKYIIDGDTVDPKLSFTNREDGLWAKLDQGGGTILSFIWAKFPAWPNDSFLTIDSTMPWAKVIFNDTVVSVPAGDYGCLAYRWYSYLSFSEYMYYYLVPDYGIVMRELYGIGPADGSYLRERWILEYRKAN